MSKNKNFLLYYLLAFLPLGFILGPAVSLINIILIGLIFITFFYDKILLKQIFSKPVALLLLVYLYLIFNLFVSTNLSLGLERNLGFIRFIIFFVAINYFFFSEKKFQLFNIWFLTLVIVLFDSFIELTTGTNILGYGEKYGERIVSFFKDEPIVAAFFNGFIFIIIGYISQNIKQNNKKIVLLILTIIIFGFCIFLTGERSNSIKFFIGIILFFSFVDFISLKKKLILLFLTLVVFTITLSQYKYMKHRFIYLIKKDVKEFISFLTINNNEYKPNQNLYLNLYISGYSVFKNNPLFGVGSKNYRFVTCDPSNKEILNNKKYWCMTHPHQIYLELLSEHGIIGTLILLSLFFTLIFQNLKIISLSKNYIQVGALVYLIVNFIPILPSGSFFSDFNLSLFFINLSIMYAVNDKTNIFKNMGR